MLVRIGIVAFVLAIVILMPVTARAEATKPPAQTVSAYDLILTVNSLRLAYGLAPYNENSILMTTAQSQAEYMASTGLVTHSGPGGSTLTQHLLAAGYPLDGDLSLGGFRAENITSGGEGMSAQAAVDGWMGDAPHQNTMLSPNLTEIGAGVAVANGRVYLVIDCARPANAPSAPSAGTPAVGSGTSLPAGEAPIVPIILSTPNAKGEVIHEVKFGQSLWQLAISYGVKIDDIKRLNGLFDNSIYSGNKLLIKIEATPTAAPPTATVAFSATPMPTAIATLRLIPSATAISMPVVPARQNSGGTMSWAVAIVVVAILGAGMMTWLGSRTGHNKTG
jgi:uncharacterized protein YkwD/LysM repeat protein